MEETIQNPSLVKMKSKGDGVWEAVVKGNLNGLFYTFDTGNGECPGLFAKAVGVNGNRGAVVNMPSTDPEGWNEDRRPALASPADLVIYELHHRDFSIDPSSGLGNKGKFLVLVVVYKSLGLTILSAILPVLGIISLGCGILVATLDNTACQEDVAPVEILLSCNHLACLNHLVDCG